MIDFKITVNTFSNKSDEDFVCLFASLKIEINYSIHPSMKANIFDIQPLDLVLTKALPKLLS